MPSVSNATADVLRRVDEEMAVRGRLINNLRPLREQKRALEAGVSATYMFVKQAVTSAVRAGTLEPRQYYAFEGRVYHVYEIKRTDPDGPPEYTIACGDVVDVD